MSDKHLSFTDMLDKALGRSYSLGQTYWQQADSEYASQNRKADKTQAKFDTMRAETVAAIAALLAERDDLKSRLEALQENRNVSTP